jgi:hypothetical protein
MGSLRYTHLGGIINIRCFIKFKNILIFSFIVNASTYGLPALIRIDNTISSDLRSKRAGFYCPGCYPASVCFDVLALAPVEKKD